MRPRGLEEDLRLRLWSTAPHRHRKKQRNRSGGGVAVTESAAVFLAVPTFLQFLSLIAAELLALVWVRRSRRPPGRARHR